MSPLDLLHMRQKRPFEPFRMHLTDGTVYDINHPELVMPGLSVAIVGIPTDPALPNVFGRRKIVALNDIVRLGSLSQTSTSKDGQT